MVCWMVGDLHRPANARAARRKGANQLSAGRCARVAKALHFFVHPFQTDRSVDANRRALREALAWLQSGGMLAMFPSGEVSHWQMPAAQVVDPAWNDTAVRLLRKTGATALPVYFCGHNSVGFQLMGMLHPMLRTAFLLQEFLQQEGKTVEVPRGQRHFCGRARRNPRRS